MGAGSASPAPHDWASRCPRSRATLFPAAAARLLLARVVAGGEGVAVLSPAVPGGYFQLRKNIFFPSPATVCRRGCKKGSEFEIFFFF